MPQGLNFQNLKTCTYEKRSFSRTVATLVTDPSNPRQGDSCSMLPHASQSTGFLIIGARAARGALPNGAPPVLARCGDSSSSRFSHSLCILKTRLDERVVLRCVSSVS